mmetsp:Transcript_27856/g.46622  ORF Transcript_27856/g.46622 Transcript_27856/m.46622 type:complete len:271 (+) Transcript_27856:8285-9097(+)
MAWSSVKLVTAKGDVSRKYERNSNTLPWKESEFSRILRASSCCSLESFSRTLNIFFLIPDQVMGASSSWRSTLSSKVMPYFLSKVTVCFKGSNMASVRSMRLRTSRMQPITSYSASFNSSSVGPASTSSASSSSSLPFLWSSPSSSPSSPSTSMLRFTRLSNTTSATSMKLYSSDMLSRTRFTRCSVYRKIHLVTQVARACLSGLASILSQPITVMEGSSEISCWTCLNCDTSCSKSSKSGSSFGPPPGFSAPFSSRNWCRYSLRSLVHR